MALADQSLVRVDESADGEPRFELLESIREYAGERLEARGEREAILARHRDWFIALAERAATELSGDDQRRWLDRLELAHDDIRAILDRAVARAGPAGRDRARVHDVAVLAEARPPRRGAASARGDGGPAVVPRRAAAAGAPARGARRRLLVAGRPRRDAGRCYEEALGDLARASATTASWRTPTTTCRSRTRSARTGRSAPAIPDGKGEAHTLAALEALPRDRRRSAARPTPSGASAPCTTSRTRRTAARRSSGRRSSSSARRATGRWRAGRSTCWASRSSASGRPRRRRTRSAMRSATSTRRATSPGSR